MRSAWVVLLSLAASCASVDGSGSPRSSAASNGALVIVGGGGTTDAIRARALELARGAETRVVVLPQASEVEHRGADSAQMWLESGAREARVLEFGDRDAAAAALASADLIWIGGGDQSRFMRETREAEPCQLKVTRRNDAVDARLLQLRARLVELELC